MSYSNPDPEPANYSSSRSPVAEGAPELKLYQAFIFSTPICFTFVILFLFYLIYLRRRSVGLSTLGMRTSIPNPTPLSLSRAELGLRKEVREMLPIIVYKESFSVTDSQCAVCLGDYQADERLQQIPACGHSFHMDCIDRWLTSRTTCPLCRLSLLPKPSPSLSLPELDSDGASAQPSNLSSEPEGGLVGGNNVGTSDASCGGTTDIGSPS